MIRILKRHIPDFETIYYLIIVALILPEAVLFVRIIIVKMKLNEKNKQWIPLLILAENSFEKTDIVQKNTMKRDMSNIHIVAPRRLERKYLFHSYINVTKEDLFEKWIDCIHCRLGILLLWNGTKLHTIRKENFSNYILNEMKPLPER